MTNLSESPARQRHHLRRAALAVAAIGAPTTLLASQQTLQASDHGDDLEVFISPEGKTETHLTLTEEDRLADGNARVEHGTLVDADGNEAGQVVSRFHYVDVRDADSDDFLFHLDCTIRLDDGSIVFGGAGDFANIPDGGETFAVWGGTGAYADATGFVTVAPGELGTHLAFELGD